MSKYHAKYDDKGKIVYEEIDGEVTINETSSFGQSAGYFVMGDIQPYKSMVTGEMIMSRSQHRKHLIQHKVIEVGNEKMVERKPEVKMPDLKAELARQLYRH